MAGFEGGVRYGWCSGVGFWRCERIARNSGFVQFFCVVCSMRKVDVFWEEEICWQWWERTESFIDVLGALVGRDWES